MPYIPHTEDDIKSMLETIGVDAIDNLFDEIPADLNNEELTEIPQGINEMQLNQLVESHAAKIKNHSNFIGAGSYEHHIPAAVWDITSRGEFLTAYTPYQAEASQGTLQLLYEYQTMMAELTGMDVSNASLYDGASAMAEAVLMAIRANRKSKTKRILMAGTIHPFYHETVDAIVRNQNIELITLDIDYSKGTTVLETLDKYQDEDITALVISQPNFFGHLEDVDTMTDWAHAKNCFVVGCVNPISLGLLKAPGQWGETGADIVCGEGQPLGAPMASGGPYFGFLTAKMAYVRQMPGRIIGRTVDAEGKEGFSLTLQAREQHIRRAKATSNICTNQGLLVTAATIHMSLIGAQGLQNIASACHHNTRVLFDSLAAIEGVSAEFSSPFFHETVINTPLPASLVLEKMREHGISAGIDLSTYHPQMTHSILFCVTEVKQDSEIEAYANALRTILGKN